jgi:hypothetical protein
MRDPDFYLASTDYYNLESPRRVWQLKRMAGLGRDDLLLVRIDPPIIDGFGSDAESIDTVVLATRHEGGTLFPVAQWPVFVYVLRPTIDNVEDRDTLRKGEFRNVAWAELYKTEEDARRKSVREGAK